MSTSGGKQPGEPQVKSVAVTARLSTIWAPHGGDYEDGCLLGCIAVYTGISLPTFQRSVLPPSSGRWLVYTALQPRRQPSLTERLLPRGQLTTWEMRNKFFWNNSNTTILIALPTCYTACLRTTQSRLQKKPRGFLITLSFSLDPYSAPLCWHI
jgi:hypothetical protein